ncbi:MAG: hypothetical protein OXJ56_13840, partial [Rhodospirillaceae bacterium]|nr:hypothetical protein [Rhodospirillaceae bacterium]
MTRECGEAREKPPILGTRIEQVLPRMQEYARTGSCFRGRVLFGIRLTKERSVSATGKQGGFRRGR